MSIRRALFHLRRFCNIVVVVVAREGSVMLLLLLLSGEALNIYQILEKTNKSLKASKQRQSQRNSTEQNEDNFLDDDILAAIG